MNLYRNWLTKKGSEKIILLHGLLGKGKNLTSLAKLLQNDFDCLLVDLRNHGQSFHSDENSLDDHAQDLFNLLD